MHPSWVRHNGTVNLITKDTINSGKNSTNNSNNSTVCHIHASDEIRTNNATNQNLKFS